MKRTPPVAKPPIPQETKPAPAETKAEEKSRILHDSYIFSPFEDQLFTGMVRDHSVTAGSPHLAWKGSRLPWPSYCQIYSFFRWVHEEHSREAQCRVLYQPQDKAWEVHVLPQSGHGAGTEEDKDENSQRIAMRKRLGEGWMQVATLHSHPSFSAFQSRTDKHDEEKQPGLHVTLGKLNETPIDLHARLVFSGYTYPDPVLAQWIDVPIKMTGLPGDLVTLIFSYYILRPRAIDFPKEWKEAIRADKFDSYRLGAYDALRRDNQGYFFPEGGGGWAPRGGWSPPWEIQNASPDSRLPEHYRRGLDPTPSPTRTDPSKSTGTSTIHLNVVGNSLSDVEYKDCERLIELLSNTFGSSVVKYYVDIRHESGRGSGFLPKSLAAKPADGPDNPDDLDAEEEVPPPPLQATQDELSCMESFVAPDGTPYYVDDDDNVYSALGLLMEDETPETMEWRV